MQFLDFGTVIFIVAAIFIFLRLRSVLGTRTGHEKPPTNPFAKRENMKTGQAAANDGDKVVALPRRKTDVDAADTVGANADLDALSPVGTPFNAALRAIREKDAGFVPDKFVDGAKLAYEMIVLAFADSECSRGDVSQNHDTWGEACLVGY